MILFVAASSVPFKLNFSGLVQQMISALSVVIILCVGGIVAFLLIRHGLRWIGFLGSSSSAASDPDPDPDPAWLQMDRDDDLTVFFDSSDDPSVPTALRRLDRQIAKKMMSLDLSKPDSYDVPYEEWRSYYRRRDDLEDLIFERNITAAEIRDRQLEQEEKEQSQRELLELRGRSRSRKRFTDFF